MPEQVVPKGECKQCWAHSKKHTSFLGLGEDECGPCLDHLANGCPRNMIQQ
ncbi:pRL2-8 [Streptomyces sp. KL116D]|uniref:pRL2-8 n=1 Tax=Streptomyces sp. KL116D TaxID=3045152 RepID=UPI003557FFFF